MSIKIYTKTGDNGTTGLFGGKRVSKNHIRIEAYGTIDELNSNIGFVRTFSPSEKTDIILNTIQNDLFVIGADLATPNKLEIKNSTFHMISSKEIEFLEICIDEFETQLPQLKNFILPGGSKCGAFLHISRTVARRVERLIVTLKENDDTINSLNIVYLNRISDLLFVMARYENYINEVSEYEWIKTNKYFSLNFF